MTPAHNVGRCGPLSNHAPASKNSPESQCKIKSLSCTTTRTPPLERIPCVSATAHSTGTRNVGSDRHGLGSLKRCTIQTNPLTSATSPGEVNHSQAKWPDTSRVGSLALCRRWCVHAMSRSALTSKRRKERETHSRDVRPKHNTPPTAWWCVLSGMHNKPPNPPKVCRNGETNQTGPTGQGRSGMRQPTVHLGC